MYNTLSVSLFMLTPLPEGEVVCVVPINYRLFSYFQFFAV